jgi:hypothetical protein
MLDKAKVFIAQNVHIVDVLFGVLWLYAWFHNAEQILKYDLDRLTTFYGVIRAYILLGRVNDSVNNSEKGVKP